MSKQKGVFKEKSAGENFILYGVGAFLFFVFLSAVFGFQFMGFIGEAGRAAGAIFKVLGFVFFALAFVILVRASGPSGNAGIGTYVGAFVFIVLSIWAAMGFAS